MVQGKLQVVRVTGAQFLVTTHGTPVVVSCGRIAKTLVDYSQKHVRLRELGVDLQRLSHMRQCGIGIILADRIERHLHGFRRARIGGVAGWNVLLPVARGRHTDQAQYETTKEASPRPGRGGRYYWRSRLAMHGQLSLKW